MKWILIGIGVVVAILALAGAVMVLWEETKWGKRK